MLLYTKYDYHYMQYFRRNGAACMTEPQASHGAGRCGMLSCICNGAVIHGSCT